MIIYTHESKLCEQILATDFMKYLDRCTLDLSDILFGGFFCILLVSLLATLCFLLWKLYKYFGGCINE